MDARAESHCCFAVQGLGSKNNRTKIECCEEICCIIQREGMGPLLSCKAKPIVAMAALLPERDGATRAAALSTIELAWAEEGDNIWKLLGRCARHLEAPLRMCWGAFLCPTC